MGRQAQWFADIPEIDDILQGIFVFGLGVAAGPAAEGEMGGIAPVESEAEVGALKGDGKPAVEPQAANNYGEPVYGDEPIGPEEPNTLVKEDAFRGDIDVSATANPKGIPKSHLDANGNYVPANPQGLYNGRPVSVAEHILGGFRRGAKSNSPYTSFSPNGTIATGYGGQFVTLDLARLRAAIASGEVTGVEIIDQAKIQSLIEGDANLSPYWKKLASRWASRDQEILIRGTIPSKFIKVTANAPSATP